MPDIGQPNGSGIKPEIKILVLIKSAENQEKLSFHISTISPAYFLSGRGFFFSSSGDFVIRKIALTCSSVVFSVSVKSN